MGFTKEQCAAEALKYNKRKDFKEKGNTYYRRAQYMGWLEEITAHMSLPKRWTESEIHSEALKYQTRKEFQINAQTIYASAKRQGILDKVCSHMISKKILLSKEEIHMEALKYQSKDEFSKKDPRNYSFAMRNSFLQEICSHMSKGNMRWEDFSDEEIIEKANSFETISNLKEKMRTLYSCLSSRKLIMDSRLTLKRQRKTILVEDIFKEAKKHETRVSFKKHNNSMYAKARELKILDQACSHMKKVGNFFYRCIYSFEWGKKFVYVGLTGNFDERHLSHKKSRRYIDFTEKYGEPTITKTEYIYTKDDAGQEEMKTLERYRAEGWTILNIAKPGALGGVNKKYSREECVEAVSKYEFLSDFCKENLSMYNCILQRRWSDILANLKRFKRKDLESLKKEALAYGSKKRLIKENRSLYHYLYVNKALDNLFST